MKKTLKTIIKVSLSVIVPVLMIFSLAVPVLAATPPAITTMDATAIMVDSAILGGNLTSLGSSSSVNVFFEYGTTDSYGNSTSAITTSSPGLYTIRLYGISSGVTYHFRARVDAGINGYAVGEDKMFTTGIRQATIYSSSVTNIVGNGATFNASLADLGTASSVLISVEYGTTKSYDMKSGTVKITEPKDVSINVTGLVPDTLYFFRMKADGGIHGFSYGAELFFRTPAVSPPEVITLPGPVVTNTTAKLVGNVSGLGTAASVTISFEYGTTIDYGLISSTQSKNSVGYSGGFTIEIKNLVPGTTYHYRAKADGGINGVAFGEDYTFKTSGVMPLTPPTVETINVTGITTGSATLNGSLSVMGTASEVEVYFEYGTTVIYGTATPDESFTKTGEFSYEIKDLIPGTVYHFRARANGFNSGGGSGSDITFMTASIPPSVSTSEASSIGVNSVTLNGVLNSMGTSKSIRVSFEYGVTGSYGVSTISKNLSETGPFSVSLPGLKANTEYHFRALADDGLSEVVTGNDMTFTSLGTASIGVAPESTLTISPSEAVTQGEINISVPFVNTGGVEGKYTATLKINGLIENTREVTIPAGATQIVSFTVAKNIPGTYQVEINGVSGSFVVKSNITTTSTTSTIPTTNTTTKSSSMMIIAIGAGAAIVIGLLIYLLMRRRA